METQDVNRETPNSLRGADAPNSRPTSKAAYGSALDSGTEGRVKTSRVLSVQLSDVSEADRHDLLYRAREAARFCNGTMADFYAQEMGYSPPDGKSFFVRFGNTLSGDVKVALGREAWAQWKRHRKDILLGKTALATFRHDRALTCRAEHVSKGERIRHAFIFCDGEDHYLNIMLCGNKSERVVSVQRDEKNKLVYGWGKRGERHKLKLWWKPQVDQRNRPVMEGLANGTIRLLKVAFVFKKRSKKIMAQLTYEKWLEPTDPDGAMATLGPLEKDGSLWLRIHGGPSCNYTARIHRMAKVKEDFGGVIKRLRAQTKRSGPKHRQAYRAKLRKAGSFSAWASGQLHEMSAQIVSDMKKHGVGRCSIGPIALGELPLHELGEKLRYKMQEAGIEEVPFDPNDPVVKRAMERVMSKQDRFVRRAKESLRMVLEEMKEEE